MVLDDSIKGAWGDVVDGAVLGVGFEVVVDGVCGVFGVEGFAGFGGVEVVEGLGEFGDGGVHSGFS